MEGGAGSLNLGLAGELGAKVDILSSPHGAALVVAKQRCWPSIRTWACEACGVRVAQRHSGWVSRGISLHKAQKTMNPRSKTAVPAGLDV